MSLLFSVFSHKDSVSGPTIFLIFPVHKHLLDYLLLEKQKKNIFEICQKAHLKQVF